MAGVILAPGRSVTRASSSCFMACFVSQDAHNCIPELDDETAMFAVYDGHGGKLVTFIVHNVCERF